MAIDFALQTQKPMRHNSNEVGGRKPLSIRAEACDLDCVMVIMRSITALILCSLLCSCMPDEKHNWLPTPPAKLEESFYRDAQKLDDVDTAVWSYLCTLVPDVGGSHRDNVAKMLSSISPELQRYYLTRLFDWERGSGGLETCMMREEDDLFLSDTIAAYEFLGASEQAQIIRGLIPIAQARWKAIKAADAAGREFDYENCPFEVFEPRWEEACERFDFYQVIFRDMKKQPVRYTHP